MRINDNNEQEQVSFLRLVKVTYVNKSVYLDKTRQRQTDVRTNRGDWGSGEGVGDGEELYRYPSLETP